MNKNLLFLLSLTFSFIGSYTKAQSTIFSEDFESCGHGTRYTEVNSHSDGGSDYFVRTDGSSGNTTVNCVSTSTTGLSAFLGMSNSFYYVGEDIDDSNLLPDSGYIMFDDIDISGFTNLEISGLFALVTNGCDNDQYMKVSVDIDNSGTFTLIGAFRTVGGGNAVNVSQDTDLDGAGDGTVLSSTFQNFTFNVIGTGSLIDIRVMVRTNTGADEFAFDNISLKGTSATTTWTGSWSNGIPNANMDVVIAENISVSSFTCRNLTINASKVLLLGSGQTVTVTGTSITNNGFGLIAVDAAGRLNLDNNGNTITLSGNISGGFRGIVEIQGTTTFATNGLITISAPSASSFGQVTGTGTVNGNISMQAFLDASTGRYFYLGSPFTNAVLSDFKESGAIMVSSSSSQGTAWEWDAANAEWDPAGGGNLANVATRGRGYAMYAGMNGSYGPFLIDDGDRTGTVSISGTISNDATVNVGLSYNDGQAAGVSFVGGSGVSATEGWNLVANPYAAIYDWEGQAIPADMSSAIYRFNGTNYSAYTKGAGSASRYIAPFQAFFVQLTANNPTNLVFDRDNRAPTQPATRSKTAAYSIDGADLHIEGMGGNVYDDLFVGFETNSTSGFDNDWDARKLLNKGITPNLYVQFGPEAYSVCRVPFTGPRSFPLKLDYVQDGDVMSISADLSSLSSFGKLTLEDRKRNVMHDLSTDYTFTQDNGFGPDRFILHFSQPSIGIEEPKEPTMVYGYADDNGLNVELGILHDATVEVYNLAGQLIERGTSLNGKATFPIEKNGLYLLKVTAKDFSQSLKVIR